MEIYEIIRLLSVITEAADRVGLNIQKAQELIANARAEGRDVTPEEIDAMLADSQSAIDRLRE